MTSVQDEIQTTAAKLLADGKADVVIGFREAALPMRAAPCFVTAPKRPGNSSGTRIA